jgi:hypothetical protein
MVRCVRASDAVLAASVPALVDVHVYVRLTVRGVALGQGETISRSVSPVPAAAARDTCRARRSAP